MNKVGFSLIGVGALIAGLLAVHYRSRLPQSARPALISAQIANVPSNSVYGLSTSDYSMLTNWLITPFIPRNEGLTSSEAEEGIRKLGTNALPALIAMLRQDDTNLAQPEGKIARSQGMATVGFKILGRTAAPAVQPLIECLDDPRPEVRASAACCLRDVGQFATSAVPKLVAALKDISPDVRACAVGALIDVPGQADIVVPALVSLLEHPQPGPRQEWERTAAIAALQMEYFDNASVAVPVLRQLTNDASSFVQSRAAGLLWRIEHPSQGILQPETAYDEQVRRFKQR